MSSYAEKHKKRSTSPVLRTTSEDRKALHANKDNYILYLEQQLEKATHNIHKRYEERMKNVEDVLQEHEDKFENFVKLIKLLQHFAESQEHENSNIKAHFNQSMDALYNTELRTIKNQIHQFEQQLLDLQQASFREQPFIQEFEQTVNKKIDVIMDELRQTVVKTDLKAIELRLAKLERVDALPPPAANPVPQQQQLQLQQQIKDLKIVIDSLIQDQEQMKQQVHKYTNELQKSSVSTLPKAKQSRTELYRESQQSDYEIMRPVKERAEQSQVVRLDKSRNKSKSLSKSKSRSKENRSLSRQNRLEQLKKSKQEKVKELIKKNKQQHTPRKK